MTEYGYNGYKITEKSKAKLLSIVPSKFVDVIAHHITFAFGVAESLPPNATTANVIAEVSDGISVQAVVVEINGTYRIPNGGIFHITVSLDRSLGATPKDSKNIIKDYEWHRLSSPFEIDIIPTFFSRS